MRRDRDSLFVLTRNLSISCRWGKSRPAGDFSARDALVGGRISLNGHYGIFGRDRAGHSALMPANFTTLAHFSVSLARRRPKLAGGPGSIVPPMSTNRAFALGSARIALISVLSRPMTSGGVFLGAMMPKNARASYPGTNWSTVG